MRKRSITKDDESWDGENVSDKIRRLDRVKQDWRKWGTKKKKTDEIQSEKCTFGMGEIKKCKLLVKYSKNAVTMSVDH